MKLQRTNLLALFIPLSALALLAGSCGDDKKSQPSAAGSTCTLTGNRCEFGCDSNLGCVQCRTNADCPPNGGRVCVLGQCAACAVNGDCGTGEACFPANHTCQTACTANADCPQIGAPNARLCNTPSGACVGCLTSADCTDPALPVCEPQRGQCGDCASRLDCSVSRPACDLQTARCVVCLVDGDCGAGYACRQDHECQALCTGNADCAGTPNRPLCNVPTGACVECLAAADCAQGTPVCNPTNHQCVGCAANTDCPVTAPICSTTGQCEQCTVNADCPADGGRRVCRPVAGVRTCVECANNADCTNAALPNCNNQGVCQA
jgi:hypothetical protein